MNEFTKEELELIADCVEADFYHSNWCKSMYEPLISKIQSMINNYCEHDEKELVGSFDNGIIIQSKCKKCMRIV